MTSWRRDGSAKTSAVLLTLGILLGTASCGQRQELMTSAPGAPPPEYAFLYEGGLGQDDVPRTWRDLPCESISLQRQGCYGTCPVYEITLRKGGDAAYDGRSFVAREGAWVGRIDIWSYARLCYLIDEMRFDELESRYAAPWTDAETTVVTVTRSGSLSPIVVNEYGGFGPPRLWAIELGIDGVAGTIDWTKRE